MGMVWLFAVAVLPSMWLIPSLVLFGPLQTEVAKSTGINLYWPAAANTSGTTAGKMISPQSIAVATSATGW